MDLPMLSSEYVHPLDRVDLATLDARAAGLQLGEIPVNVNGNLSRAEAVIVMLNSGWGPDGVEWARANPDLHEVRQIARRKNVHQSHTSADEWPFYDLDPRFSTHPGGKRWRSKLGSVIRALSDRLRMDEEQAVRELATRVAVVQRFAYASPDAKSFKQQWSEIASAQAARSLVRGLICEGEKLVVVVRGALFFEVGPQDQGLNLVVYDPKTTEPVRGDLSLSSSGGKAIFERLLVR